MANALNRATKTYLVSVDPPDHPTEDWVINPDLSSVAGVPTRYWNIVGDTVSEMTQPEKDAVDAAVAAAVLITRAESSLGDDEYQTTSSNYQPVIAVRPTNSFQAGTYKVDWSAAVQRQSNRGLVNIRVQGDAATLFELSDIDPKQWIQQTGFHKVDLTEATHTFELQIASTESGRAVFMKNAQLAVALEVN